MQPEKMPSGNLTLTVQPGKPPPSWDRRALFFSNIHSIFYGNADETRQLMDEITGAHSYGGRVGGRKPRAALAARMSSSPLFLWLNTLACPSMRKPV